MIQKKWLHIWTYIDIDTGEINKYYQKQNIKNIIIIKNTIQYETTKYNRVAKHTIEYRPSEYTQLELW